VRNDDDPHEFVRGFDPNPVVTKPVNAVPPSEEAI